MYVSLREKMSDKKKWKTLTLLDRCALKHRGAYHDASHLVSKSEFLGKSWPRCAWRFPRISSRIMSRRGASRLSPSISTDDSPMNGRELLRRHRHRVSLSPRKNVVYSLPTVINARTTARIYLPDIWAYERKHLHFLINLCISDGHISNTDYWK